MSQQMVFQQKMELFAFNLYPFKFFFCSIDVKEYIYKERIKN